MRKRRPEKKVQEVVKEWEDEMARGTPAMKREAEQNEEEDGRGGEERRDAATETKRRPAKIRTTNIKARRCRQNFTRLN